MNFAPQVETTEISDAALDAVSGGLVAGGAGGLHLETPLGDLCADLAAVGSADGLVAGGSIQAAAH